MSDSPKIQATHLARQACVYVRQSTEAQVQVNRESTLQQYQLARRANDLGWPENRVQVIDEDLAHSGSGVVARQGFVRMTQEVALGQIGIVLCLEASRLARNNAEWYRLLDLCGVTNTLIGDADGLYHPGLFNDRLLLGLKGTMAEAELHVLRARLDGGIRNKAKRGELRRGLPVGLIWGEADGEIRFHPDEAVTGAIRTVFEKFAQLGSARQVWLWFQTEGLQFPHSSPKGQIQWVTPTYVNILSVLGNPAYAGAYAYGKTRCERYVDDSGSLRTRIKHLSREQWAVFIADHHPGFIDWTTFEMNQERLASNAPPGAGEAAGVPREGSALLQGLARCGRCGRKLHVYYQGDHSTPGYYCPSRDVQKVPVGDPVVDLWVKRLHLVSIVAHLQSAPFVPDWLGLSSLLWGRPTPDGALPPAPGLPGSLASLSLRAVSSHPGEPVGCVQVSLHRQWQASSNPEDWPLPLCVTRPNQVHLRYGSQVRRAGLRLGDCSFQRRFGYMLDTYLTC